MQFPTHLLLLIASLVCTIGPAHSETFKCTINGKSVISDTPCMAGASRVDQNSDQVSAEQRRQAEQVHRSNRTQLREMEYAAARDRANRGGVAVIDTGLTPASTPPQPYRR